MSEPHSDRWHFEPVAEHTGLMQFARNDAGAVTLNGRLDVFRAEVFKVGSKTFAEGLVRSGKCSHVAEDTPLGQPDEYKPKKTSAPPTAIEEPEPTEG